MNFLCIAYGASADVVRNGWWNRKQSFNTQKEAETCGLHQFAIPGVFGYVVIEETEDGWKIVEDLGAPVKVSYKNKTFSVREAT